MYIYVYTDAPVGDCDECNCDEMVDVHHDVVFVSLLEEAVRVARGDNGIYIYTLLYIRVYIYVCVCLCVCVCSCV